MQNVSFLVTEIKKFCWKCKSFFVFLKIQACIIILLSFFYHFLRFRICNFEFVHPVGRPQCNGRYCWQASLLHLWPSFSSTRMITRGPYTNYVSRFWRFFLQIANFHLKLKINKVLLTLLDLTLNFGGRWNKLACQKKRPFHWGSPIRVTKFSVRSRNVVKISSSGTIL